MDEKRRDESSDPAGNERSVDQKVIDRFRQFLVGKGYALSQADLDDGLALGELEQKEGQAEAEQDEQHGRILLDVEKERIKREEIKKKLREEEIKAAAEYLRNKVVDALALRFGDQARLLRSSLKIDSPAIELLTAIAEPFPRLSSLASVMEINEEIRKRIFYLVGHPVFMQELGRRPRKINNLQTAMGLIGIDVLKLIVPAMLFKYRIRMYNPITPLMGPKLWRHVLTTAQTLMFLLQQGGYRRPTEGFLLGAMANLGTICCYNQFLHGFDEVKSECMLLARDENNKKLHDALFDVKADAMIMIPLMERHERKLSAGLAEVGFSKPFPHLVNALQEEASNVPFEERHLLGQSLYRALRYSYFEQLRGAKLFAKPELEPYLAASNIDTPLFHRLFNAKLWQIDYSQFQNNE